MKGKLFILILGLTLLFAGCRIQTDPPEGDYRLELVLNIDNVGESINVDGTTLYVEEFKFIVRKFNLITDQGDIIQSGGDLSSLVFSYRDGFEQDNLVLGVNIGFREFQVFDQYEMFVDQALDSDQILDNDFYEQDAPNNSIVIKGTVNDRSFFMTSTVAYEQMFELGDIELSRNLETLFIRKLLDVEDVFIDPETGELINPRDDENHDRIIEQFQENLRIEAFARTRFF